jgi:hypothetical protein
VRRPRRSRRRGAFGSAPIPFRHRPRRLPPAFGTGRSRRGDASHEVWLGVPTAFAGRAVPHVMKLPASPPSRFDVYPAAAPTPSPGSSLRFSLGLASDQSPSGFLVASDAAAAGHSCPTSFSVHVPGPRTRQLSRLGRELDRSRQRSWDSLVPFAVLIRSMGERGFLSSCRLVAHMPFSFAPAASFIVAGFAA